ncbi:universal stress protein [Akkermansiaceae bacterium]|nr:universal stress protein [Akkermansiaceae bacterium]
MKPQNHHLLRRILVPLDPSEYAQSATEYACRVARAHSSKIMGLAVLDSPEIRSSLMPSQYGYLEMVQEAIEVHQEHAKAEIERFETHFVEKCYGENVIASEMMKEGVPVDLILDTATMFDLMVVGLRTFFHFETREGDGELLSKILGSATTPILAVPYQPREMKKVLIAFDGSQASARAARDFVLFAQPFDFEVDLFVADVDAGRQAIHVNRLQEYLCDHEIPVNETICFEGKPTGAIEKGLTSGYDLIVCGTHSKKMIKDLFVGSFTQRLIEKQENALFLSH